MWVFLSQYLSNIGPGFLINNNGLVLTNHHVVGSNKQVKIRTSNKTYNGKVIAKGTPSELVKNPNAQSAYFGDSFKFN